MEPNEDKADDERERQQGRGRDAPRIARGCIDASTELWSGGCRVLGSLFSDFGDSLTRPQAVRRRPRAVDQPTAQDSAEQSPSTGCADTYRDVVDAVLTSVGNSVSGAADTVQRSLDHVARTIAPERQDEIDESDARGSRRPAGTPPSTPKSAGVKGEQKAEPKKE